MQLTFEQCIATFMIRQYCKNYRLIIDVLIIVPGGGDLMLGDV